MSIIRQLSLIGMDELYKMEPTHRFNAIFSTINLEPIWVLFEKNTNVGAPRELNYGAMVYSLKKYLCNIEFRIQCRIGTLYYSKSKSLSNCLINEHSGVSGNSSPENKLSM